MDSSTSGQPGEPRRECRLADEAERHFIQLVWGLTESPDWVLLHRRPASEFLVPEDPALRGYDYELWGIREPRSIDDGRYPPALVCPDASFTAYRVRAYTQGTDLAIQKIFLPDGSVPLTIVGLETFADGKLPSAEQIKRTWDGRHVLLRQAAKTPGPKADAARDLRRLEEAVRAIKDRQEVVDRPGLADELSLTPPGVDKMMRRAGVENLRGLLQRMGISYNWYK